ncbi:MAG TPA: hypothetical protein DCG75_12990 [Bacteroidales bacterium]|nr:hypothetical protein [Bacteroidales bacterium]
MNAQQGSPFTLSLDYFPDNNGKKPAMLNSNFSLNMPVHRDTLFTCITGTNFKYFKLNLQEDSLNINNLYSWSMPVTGILRISPNKIITLLVEPIISSDFKDISVSDFRYNLALFYVKKKNLNSTLGIGIAFSKKFSGFQLVPLCLVNMRFGNRWILSGTIPFKSKLAYEIKNKKQVGISFGVNSNSFRLSEIDNNCYMDYQAIEVSIFYQQPLLKHFKWNVNLGMQSTQIEIYGENQTSPLSIFPLFKNKLVNPIESFKNKGMLLFQVNFSYALFE